MAAIIAVGVANTKAHGQNTTKMVTARIICPLSNHVSAAAVCQTDNLRFSSVGRLHQLNHSLDGTVCSNFGCSHFKCTKLIDCTTGNRIAHCFIRWQGFSGHHCLIDRSLPICNHAVYRNRFPRQYSQQILHLYLFRWYDFLCTASQYTCGLWCQMHQFFNACTGFCNGQIF